jgi:hypothetical protein
MGVTQSHTPPAAVNASFAYDVDGLCGALFSLRVMHGLAAPTPRHGG